MKLNGAYEIKNKETIQKLLDLVTNKNGPSYAGVGIGGEGVTTFTIVDPTGEGLTTARFFCRKRKCVIVDEFNIR